MNVNVDEPWGNNAIVTVDDLKIQEGSPGQFLRGNMGINGSYIAVPDHDVHDPVMTVRVHDMAAL